MINDLLNLNRNNLKRIPPHFLEPSPFIAAIKRLTLINKIKARDPLTDSDMDLAEQILKAASNHNPNQEIDPC